MNERGFTLVEILVALAVVSISLVGLIKAQAQQTQNLTYFEQKTFADLIAANIATDLRLNESAPLGDRNGTETLAKRQWHWRVITRNTPNASIAQAVISVYKPSKNKPRLDAEALSELTVYLAR